MIDRRARATPRRITRRTAAWPPLPEDAAELEERKLATVLFADVVGFTSLADRTDHEVVARMVDAAFRRLSEVVDRARRNSRQVHG